MVSHIDIFPTLCELLEIERPAWLQGVSLMPLVRGEARRGRARRSSPRALTTPPTSPSACVRTSAGSTSGGSSTATRRCRKRGRQPVEGLVVGERLAAEPLDAEQLYDLILDPNETVNLIGDASLEAESG